MRALGFLTLVWVLAQASSAWGSGRIHEVSYAGSDKPGELVFGVRYRVWIPDGVKTLRGLIVHQHGCGKGACQGGLTAADDLQWQALAERWDCALLGPSYQQEDGQNCRLWCDPRNGSRTRFLQALDDLAKTTKHPELATVPWCLWGHSGGGFWSSLMMTSDTERIVAVWLRSGTAFQAWEKGEIARPEIPASVYQIPVVCNPGLKERDDPRFKSAWTGAQAMFAAFRAKGAPIAFAADPRTGHECGESRDLAIPFFDECLGARLPEVGASSARLRPLVLEDSWLGDNETSRAMPKSQFEGKPEASSLLFNTRIAKAWMAYTQFGEVGDQTPPPSPTGLVATRTQDGAIELRWESRADLESGLSGFVIERDGKEIARIPEKSTPRFEVPVFQGLSYHDTPNQPLAVMRFVDKTKPAGGPHSYRVIAINGTRLESPASTAVTVP